MQEITTICRGPVLLAALALICRPHPAAATKYVSNQGVDSPTCGGSTDPCRSISLAIANSAGGGEGISVDAGVDGDANGNGSFGDPGDEAAEIASGCNGMIKVNKAVRIMHVNASLFDCVLPPGDQGTVHRRKDFAHGDLTRSCLGRKAAGAHGEVGITSRSPRDPLRGSGANRGLRSCARCFSVLILARVGPGR